MVRLATRCTTSGASYSEQGSAPTPASLGTTTSRQAASACTTQARIEADAMEASRAEPCA